MALRICRLCLCHTQIVYSVFEYNSEQLPEIILRCTAVEILKDDGLPSTACVTCIETVTQFDSFRKRCQDSDQTLQKQFLISSDNSSNNNPQDCVELSNTFSTERKLNQETVVDKLGIKNIRIRREVKTELQYTETNESQCSTDDGNDSDEAEETPFSDPDYKPQEENFAPKLDIPLRKRKRKIKAQPVQRPHLVYTEQDYAILEGERKVRIYEVDDTIKEIIGHNIYTCEICMINFDSFFEYYDHQEVHNGELVFACCKCNEVFSDRQSLVEHDARHKVACKICDLEVLPKSMSAHLLIHTDIHKCPECGMRHTSNASLEKHVKARHTGIKGFVCHVCGKQSSCQSSMNRHMAYHSSERPYKCKYCDFCAKSLNIVQVHTSRKHFAEKCVCEICAKLFKSQPSLIQHMKRIHTARKHICDICGKAFIERYNLNRHLRKHAGQRLHECKICHKEFFTIRKLKEHMHSHRQGCVNCPKCGREFFYKKYFTKHVLKCTKTDDNSIVINSNECISVIPSFK